jgi:Periplasmic binding protein
MEKAGPRQKPANAVVDREDELPGNSFTRQIGRRKLLQAGFVVSAAQVASPFVRRARAADSVKIGVDNPLTGAFAANGKNELVGFQLAVEQINAKGGVLGRKLELLVEDSTSGDAGTAVQKARKLIDGDKVDFLLGNVNSALALAMAQVSNEKKILHIVPGGHTDAITGASCHWNVFRVCNTTQMEAVAITGTLIKNYGKKFYYITLDYAFGHTLEAGMVKACAELGGSRIGGALTPLGTVDFSSYLIGAQAANPDVIVFLLGGDDMVNGLKQAVRPVRARQETPPRRRAAGAGAARRIAARGAHRHVGHGMVLEAAGRAARRRIRRDDQEEDWPCADRAHLVRVRVGLDVRACGGWGQVAGCGGDGEGVARIPAAAGNRSLAESGLLSRRAESAHRQPVCRQRPSQRRRAGRSLQGDQRRQRRRYRSDGRGERVQDDVAGLSTPLRRPSA